MAVHCVSVNGLQKMVSKLNELGKNVEKTVDTSLHKSAYDIKREVESNIQRIGAVDTGRLLRSITVEKLGNCRYAVGTNVEYAAPIEFGTGSVGDPSVAHTARTSWVYFNTKLGEFRTAYPQPARPYMRPAFNTKRDVVRLNLTNAIVRAWSEGVGL